MKFQKLKNVSYKLVACFILFLSVFVFKGICLSKDTVQAFKNGKIDWAEGIIIAWGEGYASNGIKDKRLARELAKRTAILEARENLIEIIRNVQLDSKVSIEDILKSWDMAEDKIKEASRISKIRSEFFEDGKARVTIEFKIYGELADSMYNFSPEENETQAEKTTTSMLQEKPEQLNELTSPVIKPKESSFKEDKKGKEGIFYSGVIIDARNLGTKPALYPKIFNEEGELVYDYTKVLYSSAIKEGMVGYERDFKSARKNLKVAPNPLILRAIGVKGEQLTDIVIKNSDTKKLIKEEKEKGFLKHGKVVIVLDNWD